MRKKIEWLWEELDKNTRRVKVIGGWIVHHDKHALAQKGKENHILCSESMTFVSDRDHEWAIVEPFDPSKTNIEKPKVNPTDFASPTK